ncbi:MAG: hypothetical protein R3B11_14770 [Nitrospira sp.]|nr:hypothetical protein [Nitrospira sp.]
MLLRVDAKSHLATRVTGERLKAFDLDERGLQDVLFRSLDRLLPDEELLIVAQSRHWQEEPDLLALDERGRLYIFEIKVWESRSENLLQALRYGQLFGTYDYGELDQLFRKFDETGRSLADAHRAAFDSTLAEKEFNRRQVFVILTNGLDFHTRQAVQYWRSSRLDVRPWVYRAYADRDGSFLLEIARFAVQDSPYEDVTAGFYILNTNYNNDPTDHEDMLQNRKAAAYFSPWKYKIERLSKGDTVFLYQSGVGIVAMGRASQKLEKTAYHGDPKHKDEEYFRTLERFQRIDPPIPAAKIKEVTGTNHRFLGTMFSLDAEGAGALVAYIQKRP